MVCKEVIYGVGGCLYRDTLVGEVGEVLHGVQKEGRATFNQGLVGLRFISGNKVKDINQASGASEASLGIYSLLSASLEMCARENVVPPLSGTALSLGQGGFGKSVSRGTACAAGMLAVGVAQSTGVSAAAAQLQMWGHPAG